MAIEMNIKITVPDSVEPSADQPEKWASGLVNNAERINDRRVEKIGDEGTFIAKVAEISHIKWTPMLDVAFTSRTGRPAALVSAYHAKGMQGAYNKWNDKLALMFATVDGVYAKRYKDQVNNSKDNWALAAAVSGLRATGDRVRGLILPQAGYWMTGDAKANQMTNHMEILDGTPYNFVIGGASPIRQMFKAAFNAQLVHAANAIFATDFLAAEIVNQNNMLVSLCNQFRAGFILAFAVGGANSRCQFDYVGDVLKLHCRVVT